MNFSTAFYPSSVPCRAPHEALRASSCIKGSVCLQSIVLNTDHRGSIQSGTVLSPSEKRQQEKVLNMRLQSLSQSKKVVEIQWSNGLACCCPLVPVTAMCMWHRVACSFERRTLCVSSDVSSAKALFPNVC